MTTINAKLDAVMNKLGNNERRMRTAHEVGAIDKPDIFWAKSRIGTGTKKWYRLTSNQDRRGEN